MRPELNAAESEFFYSSPHLVPEVGYADERNPSNSAAFGLTRSQSEEPANCLGDTQRLRKFLEAHGTRIAAPDDRNFETEGEAIESEHRRTMQGRDMVMRSLIQAVYRFRDATLVDEKKGDFGSALQNLDRELVRAGDLFRPS